MNNQDYSWIKPGVLAVITYSPGGLNLGAIVEVLTFPAVVKNTINTITGEFLPAELGVYVDGVTPLRAGPFRGATNMMTAPCRALHPLDFPEEADIQEISRDMEVVG